VEQREKSCPGRLQLLKGAGLEEHLGGFEGLCVGGGCFWFVVWGGCVWGCEGDLVVWLVFCRLEISETPRKSKDPVLKTGGAFEQAEQQRFLRREI